MLVCGLRFVMVRGRLMLPKVQGQRIVRMGMAVRVRMTMWVVVAVLVMFVMVVIIMMMVLVPVLMRMDVELYTFDARLVFAVRVDVVLIEPEFGQFALELGQGNPEIDQRAVEHVSADSAENIKIKRFHAPPRLRC